MIINQANAIPVAKLFSALLDERFSMRTLAGIRKAAGGDEALTDQVIANLAADMGMPIRSRLRDNAMLIERPVAVEQLRTICAKVQLVAAGTEAEFDVDFAPVVEAEPVSIDELFVAPVDATEPTVH